MEASEMENSAADGKLCFRLHIHLFGSFTPDRLSHAPHAHAHKSSENRRTGHDGRILKSKVLKSREVERESPKTGRAGVGSKPNQKSGIE